MQQKKKFNGNKKLTQCLALLTCWSFKHAKKWKIYGKFLRSSSFFMLISLFKRTKKHIVSIFFRWHPFNVPCHRIASFYHRRQSVESEKWTFFCVLEFKAFDAVLNWKAILSSDWKFTLEKVQVHVMDLTERGRALK